MMRARARAPVRSAPVRSAVAAMAAVMAVGARAGAVPLFADVRLRSSRGGARGMEPGEHGRDEEEDAVHDTEGKAGLEHAARLVDRDVKPIDAGGAEDAEGDIQSVAAREMGAVGISDEAQVVHASDEGTDESQIDESDELGVGAATVVAEQRRYGPGQRQHRHDERDQDVVGRQLVLVDEAVDEPGEHAHRRDLPCVGG